VFEAISLGLFGNPLVNKLGAQILCLGHQLLQVWGPQVVLNLDNNFNICLILNAFMSMHGYT